MKKRLVITLLVVVIMVAGVGAGVLLVRQQQELREKAAPATTLTLVSTKDTPEVGETFTVMVNINSGENQSTGADLFIEYDPLILEAVDVMVGSFFTNIKTIGPNIDNSLGELVYRMYLPLNGTPVRGEGTIAEITFNAKAEGTSAISFTGRTASSTGTAAGGDDEDVNVLVAANPTTVTVIALTPTITPTTVLSPTPTQTPTPTPTTTNGTGGGGNGDDDDLLAAITPTITPK